MARTRPVLNWDEVPQIFDTAYAARLIGFSADKIARKCKEGEIPAHKIFNEWRISKEEFKEYIYSN